MTKNIPKMLFKQEGGNVQGEKIRVADIQMHTESWFRMGLESKR